MIGVERNGCVSEVGDDERNASLRRLHLNRHTDFRFDAADLELTPLNCLHKLVNAFAISLIGRDDYLFRFADLHADQSLVEAGNDLAETDRENERLAALGRIKNFAAVKFAGVMNLH